MTLDKLISVLQALPSAVTYKLHKIHHLPTFLGLCVLRVVWSTHATCSNRIWGTSFPPQDSLSLHWELTYTSPTREDDDSIHREETGPHLSPAPEVSTTAVSGHPVCRERNQGRTDSAGWKAIFKLT